MCRYGLAGVRSAASPVPDDSSAGVTRLPSSPRSRGVWWLAAIWHTTLNIVGGQFLFRMVEGRDQVRLGVLMVAGYAGLALAVWILDRRRLMESSAGGGAVAEVPVG